MFDTIASSAGGSEEMRTTSTIRRRYYGSRMRSRRQSGERQQDLSDVSESFFDRKKAQDNASKHEVGNESAISRSMLCTNREKVGDLPRRKAQ